MGWGSAYSLFNTVADALIEADASDDVKERALTKVIRELQDEDWDTRHRESVRQQQRPLGLTAMAC